MKCKCSFKVLIISSMLQLFVLLGYTFGQTRDQYEIKSVKAYLFVGSSDGMLDNTDILSDNIITDSVNHFFNVIISYPSTNTLIVVELIETSDIGGSEGEVRLTVSGNKNRKVYSSTQDFMFLNMEYLYLPFFLYDTGCEPLRIKVELLRNKKVIATREEKITFECGE